MIETVIRNLLSNAVKFSNPGGTIIIRAKSENKRILFEVQDCGKGMTTQQLENLKEGITFTTNGTANEKGNGFGYSMFNADSPYTSTLSARYYKDGSEILIDQSSLKGNRLWRDRVRIRSSNPFLKQFCKG